MKSVTKIGVLAIWAGLVWPTYGQEFWQVTGQSRAGAATWVEADGTERGVEVQSALTAGTLNVAAQAQVMMFEAGGVALVVLGPATVGLNRDEIRNEMRVELRQGKAMFVMAAGAGRGGAVVVNVPMLGAREAVGLRIGPGRVYVAVDDQEVGVAYMADAGVRPISVTVGEKVMPLAANQLLAAPSGAEARVGPVGNWVGEEGFVANWGRNLGVESARVARKVVEASLFTNIIEWDKYAGASYVTVRLAEWRFNPEIRQTVQSVTSAARQTGRGAAAQTTSTPGANEVPIISPASASVQNLSDIGQGVTAEQLNRNAAALLGLTGSRGLGFGGLANLAVPGISGGIRTIGPAGLGAQRP